jgi:hypothetical protein
MVERENSLSVAGQTGTASALATPLSVNEWFSVIAIHGLHQQPSLHVGHLHASRRLTEAVRFGNVRQQFRFSRSHDDLIVTKDANARSHDDSKSFRMLHGKSVSTRGATKPSLSRRLRKAESGVDSVCRGRLLR